jgi:Mn2+/Fe2+ NRAMP family transporter
MSALGAVVMPRSLFLHSVSAGRFWPRTAGLI